MTEPPSRPPRNVSLAGVFAACGVLALALAPFVAGLWWEIEHRVLHHATAGPGP